MNERRAYLRILALNSLHLFERLEECSRSVLQALENTVVFLLIQRITRIPFHWRIDLHLDKALTNDGRTQADTDEFVDLRRDFRIEAYELKIASSVSALADHTFRDAIQGREFEIIEFAVGVLLLQISEAFLEGVEFAFEDVGLIYFVCEDDELFFCGE